MSPIRRKLTSALAYHRQHGSAAFLSLAKRRLSGYWRRKFGPTAFLVRLRMAARRPLVFRQVDTPTVSIIIPVHNQLHFTRRCLAAIRDNTDGVPYEVILVDDASTDATQAELQAVPGLRYLRQDVNQGFIRTCNAGAKIARGKYLLFLNNDTAVMPGWLAPLAARASEDGVGAVGSRLIYPDGTMQEAGGIIWSDARGWNYGRREWPEEPEYCYPREVDYCSGASLLVRADLFAELGGFSEEFAPAYYEDTDLCFSLRSRGYKVMYEPLSCVVHYEGISSGTSVEHGVKRYQAENEKKFRRKWADSLAEHCVSDNPDVVAGARRLRARPTVLIIDSRLPLPDQDSGSFRMMQIIRALLRLGCSIIFAPADGDRPEPYAADLQSMGVEVLYKTSTRLSMADQILQRLPLCDIVWICRPETGRNFLNLARENSKAKIIYDTIDLHFVRMKRALELGDQSGREWQEMEQLELDLTRAADRTIVVTETEKRKLGEYGVDRVEIVPNIHVPYTGDRPGFEERGGILFIGSYQHAPNVDAVEWLCKSVMPIVRKTLPDVDVTLLGSMPSAAVTALASSHVKVTGYVPEVGEYFLRNRVFVSPLRYGAGMKGKIGQSLGFGLPVVTTSIGAEGMGLVDGVDALVADGERAFADAIVRAYTDRSLWESLAANSVETVKRWSPDAVESTIAEIIRTLAPAPTPSRTVTIERNVGRA